MPPKYRKKINMKNKQMKNRKSKKQTIKNSKIKYINKKMKFTDVIESNSEAAWILINKGMHCAGCNMADAETLEQGALMHGINPDKLVKEINGALFKKETSERKAKGKKI